VVEVFQNRRGKWQWRLVGTNGEILAHSEEYSSNAECNDTVESICGKRIEKP